MTKVILARLDGSDADDAVLNCAHQIAVRFGSHIKALHVRWNRADLPLLPTSTPEQAVAEARRHIERWKARSNIDSADTPDPDSTGPSVEFLEGSGDQIEQLMAHAVLADLVVLARPTPASGILVHLALEAALFDSGRPVLLVPPVAPTEMFVNPVIAWNGSPQSARALGMNLSIIKRCSGIASILTVPEPDRKASAADVLTYLRWHKVNAEIAAPDATDVGAQLLALAYQRGSGLIICGAYARSRLRHALLGGVTSHLIDNSSFPVLMAH